MTAFRRLNRLPTFRDSFGSLLGLADSELREVHDAVRATANDPDAAEAVSDDLVPAYTALAVLRQIAADEEVGLLIDDINAGWKDAPAGAVQRLLPFLQPTELDRDRQEIREAEQSTLPIAVDGKVSLDYRVIQSHDDKVKLVPLFLLRLDFDEPIGGSPAVAFQADIEGVTRIRDLLNSALALIPRSVNAIAKDALHEQTIAKYGAE